MNFLNLYIQEFKIMNSGSNSIHGLIGRDICILFKHSNLIYIFPADFYPPPIPPLDPPSPLPPRPHHHHHGRPLTHCTGQATGFKRWKYVLYCLLIQLLISGIYVGNVIAHLANDKKYKRSKNINDNLLPIPRQ